MLSTDVLKTAQDCAKKWLKEVLRLMGYEAASVEASGREDFSEVLLQVRGGGVAELLTQNARGFEALELILHRAMPRVTGYPEIRVELDVEGHREQKTERLLQAARDAAERVRATGLPYVFEPLPAAARKMIHNTLRYVPGMETLSGPPDERGDKRLTIRLCGAKPEAAS